MSRYLTALAAALVLAVSGTIAAAAPPLPSLSLGAGLGCGVQCITQAKVVATKTSATIQVHTDTAAKITVEAGTAAPMPTSLGPIFASPAATATSAGLTTSFTAELAGLEPGTLYHVVVRAIDGKGRVATRQGTFETKPLERSATVTFYSIDVIDDGDNGAYGAGELQFWLRAGNAWAGPESWDAYHVVKSGKTIQLKSGSRNGIYVGVSDPPDLLALKTLGVECDEALWSNCLYESGTFPETGGGSISDPKFEYANAASFVDLDECAAPDALPPNYGTGLPAGGDCYFSFETKAYHLKFRVNGWVDVSFH